MLRRIAKNQKKNNTQQKAENKEQDKSPSTPTILTRTRNEKGAYTPLMSALLSFYFPPPLFRCDTKREKISSTPEGKKTPSLLGQYVNKKSFPDFLCLPFPFPVSTRFRVRPVIKNSSSERTQKTDHTHLHKLDFIKIKKKRPLTLPYLVLLHTIKA